MTEDSTFGQTARHTALDDFPHVEIEGRLHRYTVDARTGEDGLTEHFDGRDLQTDIAVRLRVIRPDLFPTPRSRSETLRRLRSHIGIGGRFLPGLLDAEAVADTVVVVEPMPAGVPLDVVLAAKASQGELFSERELLPIVVHLAAALEAIPPPLRHGEVRPEHIYIDPDRLQLFGAFLAPCLVPSQITALLKRSEGLRKVFAPEVARGSGSDASDRFAVGLIIHHALTGQAPERGGAPLDLERHGEVGQQLADLLHRDPHRRPPSLAPLVEALSVQAGLPLPQLDPGAYRRRGRGVISGQTPLVDKEVDSVAETREDSRPPAIPDAPSELTTIPEEFVERRSFDDEDGVTRLVADPLAEPATLRPPPVASSDLAPNLNATVETAANEPLIASSKPSAPPPLARRQSPMRAAPGDAIPTGSPDDFDEDDPSETTQLRDADAIGLKPLAALPAITSSDPAPQPLGPVAGLAAILPPSPLVPLGDEDPTVRGNLEGIAAGEARPATTDASEWDDDGETELKDPEMSVTTGVQEDEDALDPAKIRRVLKDTDDSLPEVDPPNLDAEDDDDEDELATHIRNPDSKRLKSQVPTDLGLGQAAAEARSSAPGSRGESALLGDLFAFEAMPGRHTKSENAPEPPTDPRILAGAAFRSDGRDSRPSQAPALQAALPMTDSERVPLDPSQPATPGSEPSIDPRLMRAALGVSLEDASDDPLDYAKTDELPREPGASSEPSIDPRLMRAALGVSLDEVDDEVPKQSSEPSIDPRLMRAALGVSLDDAAPEASSQPPMSAGLGSLYDAAPPAQPKRESTQQLEFEQLDIIGDQRASSEPEAPAAAALSIPTPVVDAAHVFGIDRDDDWDEGSEALLDPRLAAARESADPYQALAPNDRSPAEAPDDGYARRSWNGEDEERPSRAPGAFKSVSAHSAKYKSMPKEKRSTDTTTWLAIVFLLLAVVVVGLGYLYRQTEAQKRRDQRIQDLIQQTDNGAQDPEKRSPSAASTMRTKSAPDQPSVMMR